MGSGSGTLVTSKDSCSQCGGELEGAWLTWKGKPYCSQCWSEMKNPPKIKCYTPDTLPQEPKWRGIKTNPEPRNELKFKTVLNRFGQKTISLPRIDDKKRWAGFPGITGISRKLARLIPICNTYVEPFAGTAKVYQEFVKLPYLAATRYVLNDKSKLIAKWLKHEFKSFDTKITSTDFKYCIKKYDDEETVFVIDQPWFKSYYEQVFSCFDRDSVKSYDEEIIELCKSIKGKFFITTRKENHTMTNSGFTNLLIESEYVVSGKYPKVLVTTNISKEDLN